LISKSKKEIKEIKRPRLKSPKQDNAIVAALISAKSKLIKQNQKKSEISNPVGWPISGSSRPTFCHRQTREEPACCWIHFLTELFKTHN